MPGVEVLGVESSSGVTAGVGSLVGETQEPSSTITASRITTEIFTVLIYLLLVPLSMLNRQEPFDGRPLQYFRRTVAIFWIPI